MFLGRHESKFIEIAFEVTVELRRFARFALMWRNNRGRTDEQ